MGSERGRLQTHPIFFDPTPWGGAWINRRYYLDYDLGYFDLETRVLEPLQNPFGLRVSPMSPERYVKDLSGPYKDWLAEGVGFEPTRPFRA